MYGIPMLSLEYIHILYGHPQSCSTRQNAPLWKLLGDSDEDKLQGKVKSCDFTTQTATRMESMRVFKLSCSASASKKIQTESKYTAHSDTKN